MATPTVTSADDAGWRFAQCFGDKVRLNSSLLSFNEVFSFDVNSSLSHLSLSCSFLQGEVEDITEADIICKLLILTSS